MVSIRSVLLAGVALLTTASAIPIIGEPIVKRQDDKLCGYETGQAIVEPAANSTIQQNEDSTTFEVIYCSGQYFKTYSIDASVFLHFPDSPNSGQLLVNNQQPDNLDTDAGFYSYRFNITIYPEDGDYLSGQQTLSVYEAASGYYNPYNYEITEIPINFAEPASPSS
ncbi:hypothetical protein MMC10_007888 [Thelotrema lepadinum]|nr:hypothetical protein [Thelotrema lepadinum]